MTIPIDRDYLTETLAGLVRINSINPTLVPGGAGEAEIAAYTAASLRSIGLETAVHEAGARPAERRRHFARQRRRPLAHAQRPL